MTYTDMCRAADIVQRTLARLAQAPQGLVDWTGDESVQVGRYAIGEAVLQEKSIRGARPVPGFKLYKEEHYYSSEWGWEADVVEVGEHRHFEDAVAEALALTVADLVGEVLAEDAQAREHAAASTLAEVAF